MQLTVDQTLQSYAIAYQRLYQRPPREMRALDREWVIINNAKIHISEVHYLTQQLEREYQQARAKKRGLVNKLIHWLKQ